MDTKEIAPGDTLIYEFDWRGASPGPWLSTGQTIAAHEVSVTGGLMLASSQAVGDKVQAQVSAPLDLALGRRCSIACKITASNGEIKTDEMALSVTR